MRNAQLLFTAFGVLAALGARPAGAAEPQLVAVLPLDASKSDLGPRDRAALEEQIRTAAGDALTPLGYTVLTGDTTLAVLVENGVDPTKVCEANCALDAARQMRARVFLAGSLIRTEGAYLALLRLYAAADGKPLGSLKLEGATVKSLRDAFEAQAAQFFR